jgi:hypothetical protein
MYMASFNSTIVRYRQLLTEQSAGSLKLPNDNLDVGTFTAAGKYKLTDATYSQLLHKMQDHYIDVPHALRSDILTFYQDLGAPNSAWANDSDSAKLIQERDRLRSVDLDLRNPAVAAVETPISK